MRRIASRCAFVAFAHRRIGFSTNTPMCRAMSSWSSTAVRIRPVYSSTSHGDRAITSTVGRVGGARHLGAIDAITRSRHAGIPDHQVWLANTDADSTVPDTWLTTQFTLANAGFDAVIGTVTPAGLDSRLEQIWRQRHQLAEGHNHVHGANLGLRASTYMRAGGFAAVSLHEDLDLVNRVKACSTRWITTHRTNVRTSARTQSRVEGGFASYLADLGSGDRP